MVRERLLHGKLLQRRLYGGPVHDEFVVVPIPTRSDGLHQVNPLRLTNPTKWSMSLSLDETLSSDRRGFDPTNVSKTTPRLPFQKAVHFFPEGSTEAQSFLPEVKLPSESRCGNSARIEITYLDFYYSFEV